MAFEFRVFIPLLDFSDQQWISDASKSNYNASLEHLVSIFTSSEQEPPRRDNYFVGKNYFGLKFRNEGKLELKVKWGPQHPFIERWVKEKYGKKGLAHYKPKILAKLESLGHRDHSMNESILHSDSQVIVEKVRNKSITDGVITEICRIKVEKDAADGSHLRPYWMSFAIETENIDQLLLFLESQDKKLWESVASCRDIFRSNDSARQYSFVPVVAGYPSFVQLVAGAIADDSEFNSLISSPLEALCSFLKMA
jgi:hypothetical protein